MVTPFIAGSWQLWVVLASCLVVVLTCMSFVLMLLPAHSFNVDRHRPGNNVLVSSQVAACSFPPCHHPDASWKHEAGAFVWRMQLAIALQFLIPAVDKQLRADCSQADRFLLEPCCDADVLYQRCILILLPVETIVREYSFKIADQYE